MVDGWTISQIEDLHKKELVANHPTKLSRTQEMLTKIHLLIQEIRDIKQEKSNNIKTNLPECQENRLFTLIFLFIFYAQLWFIPMNSFPSPFMLYFILLSLVFMDATPRPQERRNSNQIRKRGIQVQMYLSGTWILNRIFPFILIIFNPLSPSTSIYLANSPLSLLSFLILISEFRPRRRRNQRHA